MFEKALSIIATICIYLALISISGLFWKYIELVQPYNCEEEIKKLQKLSNEYLKVFSSLQIVLLVIIALQAVLCILNYINWVEIILALGLIVPILFFKFTTKKIIKMINENKINSVMNIKNFITKKIPVINVYILLISLLPVIKILF